MSDGDKLECKCEQCGHGEFRLLIARLVHESIERYAQRGDEIRGRAEGPPAP